MSEILQNLFSGQFGQAVLQWGQQGLSALPWWGVLLAALGMTQLTIVSVTLYLHRHSAHRALELHPVLKHLFRAWLWLSTAMNTREWTAVHRRHHAFCETERDPHSPRIYGIRKVLLEGAELYREGADADTVARYGKGTPDDWMERHVYSAWPNLGIALMLLINLALFGVIGLTVWAVQMLWIPIFAAGVINGIGHYWGYRNFECPDAATNVVPWGLLVGGEELHNNHHTYPNSAKFSVKPWEIDLGWAWIRLFQALKLAKPLSTGPVVARDPARTEIDTNTVWGVLNDRFKVLASYADQVVKPLVEYEYHRADGASRRLYRRARRLLIRDESLVDAQGRAQLSHLMAQSPSLKTIYEFRQRLVQVCAKRSGSSEEALRAFRQWCLDAEASGIAALKDFVEELKSYTMPNRSAFGQSPAGAA